MNYNDLKHICNYSYKDVALPGGGIGIALKRSKQITDLAVYQLLARFYIAGRKSKGLAGMMDFLPICL